MRTPSREKDETLSTLRQPQENRTVRTPGKENHKTFGSLCKHRERRTTRRLAYCANTGKGEPQDVWLTVQTPGKENHKTFGLLCERQEKNKDEISGTLCEHQARKTARLSSSARYTKMRITWTKFSVLIQGNCYWIYVLIVRRLMPHLTTPCPPPPVCL